MRFPKLNPHIRFYKYADEWTMVKWVCDSRWITMYQKGDRLKRSMIVYKNVGRDSYSVYNYTDWAEQKDVLPDYIPMEQKFNWYFQYWKKNK